MTMGPEPMMSTFAMSLRRGMSYVFTSTCNYLALDSTNLNCHDERSEASAFLPFPKKQIPRGLKPARDDNSRDFSVLTINAIPAPLKARPLREALNLAGLVLADSPANVVRHTGINPPRLASYDVDPEVPLALHGALPSATSPHSRVVMTSEARHLLFSPSPKSRSLAG